MLHIIYCLIDVTGRAFPQWLQDSAPLHITLWGVFFGYIVEI